VYDKTPIVFIKNCVEMITWFTITFGVKNTLIKKMTTNTKLTLVGSKGFKRCWKNTHIRQKQKDKKVLTLCVKI